MKQLSIDRRGLGVVGLVVSAGLAVTGSLLPLYELSETTGGTTWRLAMTAWQTYLSPLGPGGGGDLAPHFGFPLVVAAALELLAAVLVLRAPTAVLVGRLAAVAGSALLLGGAWSAMLFITQFAARIEAPQSGRIGSIGIGMIAIGAAWVLGTAGAVLVQDLPSAEPEPAPELAAEPDYDLDEAVVYRIDDEAAEDVDTPPLGFPELTLQERFVELVDEDRGTKSP
jgi:hypothetical protein